MKPRGNEKEPVPFVRDLCPESTATATIGKIGTPGGEINSGKSYFIFNTITKGFLEFRLYSRIFA